MKAISDVRYSDNAATVGSVILLCLFISSVPVPKAAAAAFLQNRMPLPEFSLENYEEHIEFISCLKQEICRTLTRKIKLTIHCW